MPALRNQKHENFAQLTVRGAAQGLSQAQIYQMAGYGAEGHAAAMAASRLMKKDDVRARIAELTAPAERKTRTTVDTLAAQLDAVFDGASGDRQWGAAGSAAALKAKLLGFMREKIEVGGVGAFAPSTVDEVMESVGRELGPEAQAVFLWMFDSNDDELPIDKLAAFMLTSMTMDQALARLDQLREALLNAASDDAKVVEAVEDARDTVDHEALALLTQPKRSTAKL
jgi:hypothetical protein